MKKILLLLLFLFGVSAAQAQVTSQTARRLAPSTFAGLGAPANGSVRYCTNCNANTSPCTSGGTGAQATRVNGTWVCSTASAVSAGGVTSINGDSTAAQVIAAGVGASITEAGATHTIAVTGEALLATVIGINLDNATAQDAYTVPTGKTLIVTRVIFSNPTGGGFIGGDTVNLRVIDSTAGTQIGTQAVAGSAGSASAVITVTMGNANLLIAAGNKVQVKPDIAYADDNTCTVRVFGVLF
jgi:hypothetical protein